PTHAITPTHLSLHTSTPAMIPPFPFFTCSPAHCDLHSFPTRRSSDLVRALREVILAEHDIAGPCLHLDAAHLAPVLPALHPDEGDRKSTRLNSSHVAISYSAFCLKKK